MEVTQHRTMTDGARVVSKLVDESYADRQRTVLVVDTWCRNKAKLPKRQRILSIATGLGRMSSGPKYATSTGWLALYSLSFGTAQARSLGRLSVDTEGGGVSAVLGLLLLTELLGIYIAGLLLRSWTVQAQCTLTICQNQGDGYEGDGAVSRILTA